MLYKIRPAVPVRIEDNASVMSHTGFGFIADSGRETSGHFKHSAKCASLFVSPTQYPITADWDRRLVLFTEMSRAAYRSSVFLDPRRIQRAANNHWTIDFTELLAATDTIPPAAGSRNTHYILHSGFSCSTLMTRFLELSSDWLVLREPDLLCGISILGLERRIANVLPLCWRLLERRFAGDSLVVVKLNDVSNRLAEDALAMNPNATATILTVPLRQFLLHVLSSDSRRAWVRDRVQQLCRMAPDWPFAHTAPASDGCAAACWWLFNTAIFECLRQRWGANRVLEITAAQVVESPDVVMRAVSEVCGLPRGDNRWIGIRQHPVSTRHSKRLEVFFDAESRRRQHAMLETLLRDEVDKAVKWADSVSSEVLLR